MTGLVNFMNTTAGRALRVVLGLVLIYVGMVMLGGTAGWIVAIIGVVPIAMGLYGHCLIGYILPKAKHA